MKKWAIRAPGMLEGMGAAAFKPTVGLVLLIALEIYLAFNKTSLIGIAVYALFLLLGKDLDSAEALLNILTTSQGFLILMLFLFATLTALTLIYIKWVEKRPLSTAGIVRGNIPLKYIAGFGTGAALLLLCFAPGMISEGVSYRGFSVLLPVYLLAFIIQSSAEEIFFRGFIMTGISKRIGIVFGVLISSVVFSLAHALNGGYSLLGGIYYLLIGAFLALLLLRTNSIWASCGVHGAWNFTIGLLGPVSMGKGLPPVDYAMFNAGKVMEDAPYTIVGDPYYLILIGVFLAAIALLLFAGQGRLIVRAPQPAAPPPAEPEGIV